VAEPLVPPAHAVPAPVEAVAALAAGPVVPSAAVGPAIPLIATRRLIPTAFDLLARSTEDIRRGSFYIGAIVLGTAGPLALGAWGVTVLGFERTNAEMDAVLRGLGGAMFAVLVSIATLGFVVAAVESRNLAVMILGGTMVGRTVTTRQALARSRVAFWRTVVAAIIVGLVLSIAQAIASAALAPILGVNAEINIATSTIVTAVIGAPFAYVLSGVVLGDVDAFEALKRSFRVYRVRKLAATIVAVFETLTALLVILGLSSGLDLVLRVFDVLGLGPDAGPAGIALTTMGIVAVIFAFGTLLFTVMAITVAPQVVMFLSLTHATLGLDRVAAGGPDDPDRQRPRPRPFSWLTRPMLAGFVIAAVAMAVLLAAFL
jgi:hypothetical protein